MKTMIIISSILFSLSGFAAATLDCVAEDGGQLQSVINATDPAAKPVQVRVSIRGSQAIDVSVTHYAEKVLSSGEAIVEELVAVNSEGLQLVITNGKWIDKTGVYSVDCEFGY